MTVRRWAVLGVVLFVLDAVVLLGNAPDFGWPSIVLAGTGGMVLGAALLLLAAEARDR